VTHATPHVCPLERLPAGTVGGEGLVTHPWVAAPGIGGAADGSPALKV